MAIETWYDIVVSLFAGIGWTPSDFLMFLGILIGLLFGSADYRIGLMSTLMLLIGGAGFFIYYGFDTMRIFILIFATIVIMALSLFVESSKGRSGLGY